MEEGAFFFVFKYLIGVSSFLARLKNMKEDTEEIVFWPLKMVSLKAGKTTYEELTTAVGNSSQQIENSSSINHSFKLFRN